MTHFFETLFYRPRWYHWIVALLLLPLSLIYGTAMWIRRQLSRRKRYPVPIISVGNLIIGGSGKTPMVIALAEYYADLKVVIVSRGYGRQSQGMVVVSREGKILVDVRQSGDEAMLMALKAPHAGVIVSEKREQAIEKAITEGAELILLDDGFNRVEIEKFEILLSPASVPNLLPLPAGPFREPFFIQSRADLVLREGRDFYRSVSYEGLRERMVLLTAIADPVRLEPFLPEGVVAKIYLDDHAYFDKAWIEKLLHRYEADSLLMTEKDWVKVKNWELPLSLMRLELRLEASLLRQLPRHTSAKR